MDKSSLIRSTGAQRRAQNTKKGFSASTKSFLTSSVDKIDLVITAGYGLRTADQWLAISKGATDIILQADFVGYSAALIAGWAIAIYIKSQLSK